MNLVAIVSLLCVALCTEQVNWSPSRYGALLRCCREQCLINCIFCWDPMGRLEVKHGHPVWGEQIFTPPTHPSENHILHLYGQGLEAAPFPRLYQSSATRAADLQVNNDPIHLPKL